MMKKYINKLSALIIGLVILSGCSEKLDINENPTQPVTTPSNLRLPAIQSNTAYHLYSHARFSAYHSFYMTSRIGNSNGIIDRWDYSGITRQGAWRWHYFDVGSNIMGMLDRAEQEGSNNFVGVGKILMAFSYLTATDSFGDMPFSEAYTGTYNPVYDTQEQVYAGVAQLLDEGLAALDNVGAAAVKMDQTSDLIYGGDLAKWRAFAHAVRARMLLHTANFRNNYDEVIAAVDAALSGGFTSAILRYPENPTNNWQRNLWGESAAQPEWQFADIRNILETSLPTDVFMKALTVDEANGIYDPRLYELTTPGNNGRYYGAKLSEGTSTLGLPTGTTFQDFANLRLGYWTSDNSPFPIFLEEELYFIRAEAAHYSNNPSGAWNDYRRGIQLNMQRLGVPEGQIINYMGSTKVAQTEGTLTISNIMMQKWIALYLQSETWVDMRRHGYRTTVYPDLYYPRNALLEWQGRWIQRFPYDPQTEYVYNPREIERLGARARNWAFTEVWWAERSTLKN